ncbi:TonB-dependent receptor [Candidatus Sulfurimonas marisnigri]|uniref:TonB-dependent receptor n=1 Tax=Candidatus Sulfurimonas marisnigri TaxID=2740405 RepID=A0A7S7M1B8_9BACT|nr:TonB-dependent receptor [Candidatus Sulfurimonas marisnigri]QOY54753.1 TonB-dependent receptor [Candidatus Sulfurimonas marisnigri]
MNKTIKLSLMVIALVSSLQAQENIIELKPLTITSTAIKTDELRATEAVEVYTAEDIEKANVQNVYEFLNQQTSVIATPGYGNQFMQKIDMRGYGIGNGYQNIVITINGRRMNNVDMVPQLLGSISPSSIEKIEIIKSSGIVVEGDGANAGVINITTKKNSDKEISLYAGTNGLVDASIYLGHNDEKLSLALSAELQKSDVIRDIDNSSPKDENKLSTGTFNLSYLATEQLELRLGFSATNTDVVYSGYLSKAQYEDNPKQEGGSTTIQEYNTHSIDLGLSYYVNDETSINIDTYTEKKESLYNYVTWSFLSAADYDYQSAKTNITYDTQNLRLKAGYDYCNSKRTTSSNEVTKDSNAGYIIGEYKLGSDSIKAGLRYEAIAFKSRGGDNQSDTLWGAELGYNKTITNDISLFVNYAHTYQSADLDRLFSYSTGAFTGYVKPSEADNFNIGFNYITKSNKFKATAYYIDLQNEIYYYSDPTFMNSRNTNIDKSHKYGLDLYNKWLITDKFDVVINYNYVQAVIDEEIENTDNYANNDLPGVSDHNIKATLEFLPNKNTTLAITQVYRSQAYSADDFNNNFSQKQDAYNSTNISASYTKDTWEVFAKINNLFNQKNGLWVQDDAIYPVNFTTTAIAGFKLKF